MDNPYEAARRRSAEYANQVAAGERCEDCGQWIFKSSPSTGKAKCYGCRQFVTTTKDVTHESRLRCPHCRHSFDAVADGDDCERCAEGEHSVCCPECERDFSIYTTIRFSYKSPELEQPNEH